MFNRIENPRITRKILEQIKMNVLDGKLRKGDRLPSERQLSEMLGVSRATIREAVKSLEMIGLIECVHGGGNYIASDMNNSLVEPLSIMFSFEGGDILQVQQLRRALEIASVRLAAKTISNSELDELEKICHDLEAKIDGIDHSYIDQDFHRIIVHASRNQLLVTTHKAAAELISSQIRDVRNVILSMEDNMHLVNEQHWAIYKSLKQHDVEMAIAAMTKHMDFIEDHLMS